MDHSEDLLPLMIYATNLFTISKEGILYLATVHKMIQELRPKLCRLLSALDLTLTETISFL